MSIRSVGMGITATLASLLAWPIYAAVAVCRRVFASVAQAWALTSANEAFGSSMRDYDNVM
jgi:hypothetical protein